MRFYSFIETTMNYNFLKLIIKMKSATAAP